MYRGNREPTAVALIKAGAYDIVAKIASSRLSHIIQKHSSWARALERLMRRCVPSKRIARTRPVQASPIAIAILEWQGAFEWGQ
jgi:hypothetical protein